MRVDLSGVDRLEGTIRLEDGGRQDRVVPDLCPRELDPALDTRFRQLSPRKDIDSDFGPSPISTV